MFGKSRNLKCHEKGENWIFPKSAEKRRTVFDFQANLPLSQKRLGRKSTSFVCRHVGGAAKNMLRASPFAFLFGLRRLQKPAAARPRGRINNSPRGGFSVPPRVLFLPHGLFLAHWVLFAQWTESEPHWTLPRTTGPRDPTGHKKQDHEGACQLLSKR